MKCPHCGCMIELNQSDNLFEKFWKAYPKKKSKGQALKAFKRIRPPEHLVNQMISVIEKTKTSPDWTKDRGQYIPYPATWLNAQGWLDEIEILREESTHDRAKRIAEEIAGQS